MSLDADSRRVLEQLADLGVRPLHELTPAQAREQVARSRLPAAQQRPVHRASDVLVPRADGSAMRVRVLCPSTDPNGCVVYFHGGGFVVGAVDDYEALGREIALGTNCVVAIVDYRLAPEHPFPAAVDDAWDAVRWAGRVQSEWTSGGPLIVAGDSAGGNLAALAAVRSRDAAGPPVALQVLIYPVADGDLETPSYRDPENQLLLTRDTMRWFWELYAPDRSVWTSPAVSPLRVRDLRGLPAALVITAEHDVLRDEGEAYADRLRLAGVPVLARRFDGQMHGFLSRYAIQPSARVAFTAILDEMRSCVGPARTISEQRG
ncbi:alpha/beta hydrolase [Jatrophihabitans cynanchi]|uniref:Alpha/beta hydrolase n=1 Tax=Jatrophihabitans cynanchi TaxID=2944128 RepID=A0ABY7K0I4_9ACTN|nr:alpha/beta hydrolase [Jatrophihabitans sp. SB3-54]WAX58359.1 alpha/beta hydrolase [Jatrophihabitans sp. SB3-54]